MLVQTTCLLAGSVQCYWRGGGCAGAAIGTGYDNHCYPFDVWTATSAGSGSYFWGTLQGGGFSVPSLPGTLAFSVRCVLFFASLFCASRVAFSPFCCVLVLFKPVFRLYLIDALVWCQSVSTAHGF